MSETGKVTINANLNVTAAAAQDYSTLLIVDCNHASFDRAAVYATPSDYTTSVTEGTPLRAALDSAFRASVRPSQVLAGRSKGKAVLAPTEAVADTVVYDFTVIVAGTGASVAVSYTAGAADTAEDVATGWKADIDAVTDITDEVTATVIGTGADAVLEITLNIGDDDFNISGVVPTVTLTSVATEAASDSIAAITDYNGEWTWLTSTDHRPSYQLSMMAAAEVLQQPYVTATQLAETYAAWNGTDTPDSNDVMALAKHNSYQYTHVMYYHDADTLYPENQRITQFTWLKPGSSSFQDKQLNGLSVAQVAEGDRALNTTELTNIESKSGSTMVQNGGVTVIGGRIRDTGNRMATGVRIEAIAVLVYTRQELARSTHTIFLNKNKVALNDTDIDLFKKTWKKFFTDNASGGGVSRAFEEANPVDITVPKAKDITFEDKADGLLQNTDIIGYMDPSIDSVIMNLNLTYSQPEG